MRPSPISKTVRHSYHHPVLHSSQHTWLLTRNLLEKTSLRHTRTPSWAACSPLHTTPPTVQPWISKTLGRAAAKEGCPLFGYQSLVHKISLESCLELWGQRQRDRRKPCEGKKKGQPKFLHIEFCHRGGQFHLWATGQADRWTVVCQQGPDLQLLFMDRRWPLGPPGGDRGANSFPSFRSAKKPLTCNLQSLERTSSQIRPVLDFNHEYKAGSFQLLWKCKDKRLSATDVRKGSVWHMKLISWRINIFLSAVHFASHNQGFRLQKTK